MKYYGGLAHQQGQFEQEEKKRAAQAKKSGQILSGYQNFDLRVGSKGGGNSTKTMQKAIYINAPKAAPAPRTAPRPAPKAAPKPAPKPKPAQPVVHSPEIKQAKERVNKYQTDIKQGKPSEEIYGNKDYSKDSYINRSSSKPFQIYDFSQSPFAN